MRGYIAVLACALAAVGCHASAAAGRVPLPERSLGSPGASGTSRADLEKTVRDAEARLAAVKDDAAATFRLAEALLRQARVAGHAGPAVKAEQALRTWMARAKDSESPNYHQARRLLVTTLASLHRFQDAIVEAERCLQVRADDATMYGIVGDSKLELGDRAAAFAAFDRMMALRPDAAAYARVAYAHELSGDLDGALRLMSMALEATSPNDVEALAWHRAQVGALQFARGRIAEAAREFDHAVFLFPDYPLGVEGQAQVAHARGQNTKALALLEGLGRGTPTSSVLSLTADVLRALNRTEEAARKDTLAEAVRATETSSRQTK